MKKRRPKSVYIFGRKLVFIPDPQLVDRGYLGLFESGPFTVRYSPLLGKDQLIQVLLHEIGHAIMDRLGLHQTNISSDACEVMVEGFATWLTENFDFNLF